MHAVAAQKHTQVVIGYPITELPTSSHCVFAVACAPTNDVDCAFALPMSSHGRAAKLARLQDFKGRLPAHSQAALESILNECKKSGIPELTSSKDQRAARRQLLDSMHGGQLGPLLQTAEVQALDGSTQNMVYCNALCYIAALYAKGGSFTELLQACHKKRPSSSFEPYSLILYSDEVIPGNILGKASRKSWCYYCTFKEFGKHISDENAWLCIAIEKSSFVASLCAGPGQIAGVILKSIFCDALIDPQCGGLLLKHSSGSMTLFFKLGIVVQDGLAHKALWNGKGDSGDHYCLLCANIRTSASTAPSSSMQARAVKYSDLALVSRSALLESFQRLHVKSKCCTKKEFQLWEMAAGITYDPCALLLNSALLEKGVLHPVEQFVHDWMHTVLQGTLPIVAYVAVDAVQCWELLHKQVSLRSFPKAWRANGLADCFEDKKLKKYKENERISLQASEMLTWYPVFRYFLMSSVVPQSIAPEATAAFLDMSNLACYAVAVHKPISWKPVGCIICSFKSIQALSWICCILGFLLAWSQGILCLQE